MKYTQEELEKILIWLEREHPNLVSDLKANLTKENDDGKDI